MTLEDGTGRPNGQGFQPYSRPSWQPGQNDWQAHASLSDTSVLDPLAWPSALQWYTLTVDSAGCSASDSTPVAPVLLNAITAFADTTVCYGSTVQIAVNGAFSVVWDYHPTLSATNVHNPIATPVADRTVYHYTATDVCGCDTIRDSIVVDVICCADIPVTARLVNPSAATWAWPTTGGVYQIEGTFLVTVPINFSHTTFLMEDGAEVRIEQTGYLRTDHSHFRTACGDSMWQGITLVEPGARLGMVTDTIQDARKAVWSKFGATFSIVSSLVRDNWIGVHMDQHPGNHTGLVLGTHFAANPFALLPPYRSVPAEAGIWIDRVGQATIGLPGAANRNTFDSVAIGVLVNRSHAVVQNCRFNRVLPKPNVPGGPGTGGYASGIFAKGVFGTGQQAFRLRVGEQAGAITGAGCRFENCRNGLFVRDNVSLVARRDTFVGLLHGQAGVRMEHNHADSLIVANSFFTGNDFGVYGNLNSRASTRIFNNSFIGTDPVQRGAIHLLDINPLGLSNLQPTLLSGNYICHPGKGITCSAIPRLEIRANTVISQGLGGVPVGQMAAINLSGCDKAVVESNALVNQTVPAPMSGLWLNVSNRVIVSCNDVSDYLADMRTRGVCNNSSFTQNDFIGGRTGLLLENNGIIGRQGNVGFPTRNEWLPGAAGAWVCGGTGQRFMSRTVGTVPPFSHRFYVRSVQGEWPGHPNNLFCNGGIPSIQFFTTPQYFQIISCPVAGSGGAANNNNAQQGGGYDEEQVAALRAIAEGQTDYLGNADAARYLERQMVLAILVEEPGLLEDDGLRTFWVAYSTGGMGRIMEATLHAEEGDFAAIPAALDFTPANMLEATHQDALMAYYRWMTGAWKGQDDSLLVADLAGRCPLDYGKGVYQARALMALVAPGQEWEDDCASGERRSGTQGSATEETVQAQPPYPVPALSPNPARTQVELSCDVDMDVEVFSSTGQLVARFGHKAGSTRVPIGGWTQGIYVFRYHIGDRVGSLRLVVE